MLLLRWQAGLVRSFDPKDERYLVRFDDGTEGMLKAANLRLNPVTRTREPARMWTAHEVRMPVTKDGQLLPTSRPSPSSSPLSKAAFAVPHIQELCASDMAEEMCGSSPKPRAKAKSRFSHNIVTDDVDPVTHKPSGTAQRRRPSTARSPARLSSPNRPRDWTKLLHLPPFLLNGSKDQAVLET